MIVFEYYMKFSLVFQRLGTSLTVLGLLVRAKVPLETPSTYPVWIAERLKCCRGSLLRPGSLEKLHPADTSHRRECLANLDVVKILHYPRER